MHTNLFLLASLTTLSVAGVPNTFRANDPARADLVNANFKHLDSAVGTKADTAALTTRLSGYATTGSLANYALAGTLSGFATTTALTNGLGEKVDTAKLTTRLGEYAKTGALASYATTTAVNGKMAASDYVVKGQLKAVGGFIGGSGITTTFTGSEIRLDTLGLLASAGSKTLLANSDRIIMRDGYNGWEVSALPATFAIISNGAKMDRTYFKISSTGLANFTTDVTIDGTLMVQGKNVPDYVFEPDYRLAPLAEVEAYTRVNKHLPEVPSAKDIQAGGMDLAKMNLVLLKKVEELTLHAIAQEKQIKNQNERLQALESRQAD